MPEYSCKELSQFRIEKAAECLISSKISLEDGGYSFSVDRSYHAIFHAIKAVFVLNGLDFKKHSAVIAKFRELYIKTGLFDKNYSPIIGNAYILWNDSNYHDFFLISKEDAEQEIENAAQFIEAISQYLNEHSAEAAAP